MGSIVKNIAAIITPNLFMNLLKDMQRGQFAVNYFGFGCVYSLETLIKSNINWIIRNQKRIKPSVFATLRRDRQRTPRKIEK